MDADIAQAREKFLNVEFDTKSFEVTAENIVEYARACGEISPRYTDPDHDDFQAPPTFASSFIAGRHLPKDYPRFGGLGMDAGKAIAPHAPVRPGTITGKTHIHDIYTKTGRSGRMVFTVIRMELFDQSGTKVADADTRTVVRERPTQ